MARMNAETKSVIQETQSSVTKTLDNPKNESLHSDELLSRVLGKWDESQMVSRLGDTNGKIFHRFLNSVNVNHPSLDSLTTKSEWKSFAADFDKIEADQAIKYRPVFRELSSWCLKPRVIADCASRTALRKSKQGRAITMKFENENGYYGQPNDFRYFIRFSKEFTNAINRLQEQSDFFKSFDLKEVSSSVAKRAKAYEEMIKEEYLGFQRITPINAAVVLSKIHGFKWVGQNIVVPPRYFTFDESVFDEKPTDQKKSDELKRPIVFRERKMPNYESAIQYTPRFYPLADFLDILPTGAKDIVEKTEALPELNNNPAFDNFWVVVPTIGLSQFKKINDGGETTWVIDNKEHTDEYQAGLALDRMLIKKSLCTPAILGDHEGLTYFVCMFS